MSISLSSLFTPKASLSSKSVIFSFKGSMYLVYVYMCKVNRDDIMPGVAFDHSFELY